MPILIKGAGDIASGIAFRLMRAGYSVIMTEIENPTAIRYRVSFAQAVYDNVCIVEGIQAVKSDIKNYKEFLEAGIIPILVDVNYSQLEFFKARAVVDAIMAKENLGTYKNDSYYTIGLGPGFLAPDEVDVAIETLGGHTLGRCIYDGKPIENTGDPKELGEDATKRLLRAPCDGVLISKIRIGDHVNEGDEIAFVTTHDDVILINATISGIVRGILRNGFQVSKNMKIGEIDPLCEIECCSTISGKSLSIAGGVLEALLHAGILPK